MSTLAFSQTDTMILIPKRVSEQIIKDLVRLDHLDSMHSIDIEYISLLDNKVESLEKVIINKDLIIENLEASSFLSEQATALTEEKVKVVEKMYRKEKRKKFIVGAVGIAAIVLLIL